MADKEATVYIVDIGKSMGKKNHGREQTDLEWSLQYVWDRITTTVNIFILATVFNVLIAGA
jgi:ATP-dependent DNA helicase 2 subunit 2